MVAEFENEGNLRDISVNFAIPNSSGGTPPPPTGKSSAPTAPSGSNSGTTAPSQAILRSVGLSTGSRPVKVREQITLLRLVSPAHGKHYVLIKVKSSASSAKVLLRLTSAAGHNATAGKHRKTTTSSKTVNVRTNRQVTIAVSSSVLKIARASLLS